MHGSIAVSSTEGRFKNGTDAGERVQVADGLSPQSRQRAANGRHRAQQAELAEGLVVRNGLVRIRGLPRWSRFFEHVSAACHAHDARASLVDLWPVNLVLVPGRCS
jgi:hypothetical protein